MGSILLAILFFYLIIENLYLRFELDLLKVDNITRWSERWEAIAAAGKFERQMKYWKYRRSSIVTGKQIGRAHV